MRRAIMALLFTGSVFSLTAAENKATPPELQRLTVLSDAVVVAHPGAVSAAPAATGGAVALWIDRSVKGPLHGGQNIVWIPGCEWPEAKVIVTPSWLLFLCQDKDGRWHLNKTPESDGRLPLTGENDPKVLAALKFLGNVGAPPPPPPPGEGDVVHWIKEASKVSASRRVDAFKALLAAGETVRPDLASALNGGDRDAAAVARTLLPLLAGGPAVNGLRLSLQPATLTLNEGEQGILTVNLANITDKDIRVVTGVSTRGDTVEASAAYEILPLGPDLQPLPDAKPLATVLPKSYGNLEKEGGTPLPLIHLAPRFDVLPQMLHVRLGQATENNKPVLRLEFPAGHVELPGPGTYSLRVRFSCPGPRPDQALLRDENYWEGGQLVSNRIVLVVK